MWNHSAWPHQQFKAGNEGGEERERENGENMSSRIKMCVSASAFIYDAFVSIKNTMSLVLNSLNAYTNKLATMLQYKYMLAYYS